MKRKAVIDMGTNTFQLLIAEVGENFNCIVEKKISVRLGNDHFSGNKINGEAEQRAINALSEFLEIIHKYNISSATAFGTSAFRNVSNSRALIDRLKSIFPFHFYIISGEEEARLIFGGAVICLDGDFPENAMLMDIGGGSTEFIIPLKEGFIYRSYDVGVQRLLSRFEPSDPITEKEINSIHDYLTIELSELREIISKHEISVLVGSAGTFDTLRDMASNTPNSSCNGEVTIDSYRELFTIILKSTKVEREKMNGMSSLRADMIVVALCLLQFVLNSHRFEKIITVRYSLKEGAAVHY